MKPPEDEKSEARAGEASFHAIVTGRVQGVGFRYFVQREAQRLGLSGTVCNRRDHSVEVQARGSRGDLERLAERLRQGPAMSRVDAVELRWGVPAPEGEGFHITRG